MFGCLVGFRKGLGRFPTVVVIPPLIHIVLPTEIDSIEPDCVTEGCSGTSDGPASGTLETVPLWTVLKALFDGTKCGY